MEFIGITAFIDALIVIATWAVLHFRMSKLTSTSNKGKALSAYLLVTCAFLVLISSTLLKTTGEFQQIMFIVSDLVLWVSLVLFIKFMYKDEANTKSEKTLISIFWVLAILRTLWQIAGVAGLDISFLGSSVLYALSQFDAWLMYAVWVPSAVYFLWIALSSDNAVVRARSLMFGIGILLMTFTWAFRFLGQATVTESTAYLLVSGASVIGFVFLLGGIFYRGSQPAMTTTAQSM